MAFVALPFGIKVEVSWTTGSGIAVCVHFVSKATPVAVSPTDLNNAIVRFDTWRQAIRGVQAATTSIAGIRATDWSVPEGISSFVVPTVSLAGSAGSAPLPLNVALCATHRTGYIGRSRRGRTYIPGLDESVVSVGDILGATPRNIVAAAYANLRTNLNTDGLVQVVASFYNDGAPRVSGQGTAVVVTSIDQYSDSQRRRLAGRGA